VDSLLHSDANTHHLSREDCRSHVQDQKRAVELDPRRARGSLWRHSSYERNVDFKMFSHEEALATDPIAASWILFAQNAALSAHTTSSKMGRSFQRVPVLARKKEAKSWGDVHTRRHDDRRRENSRKIRKGRRPSFSIVGTIRSCGHCFERPPGRANVTTTLRQKTKFCRELAIREDRLALIPRASVGFGVA
jgi:hypothetical protein